MVEITNGSSIWFDSARLFDYHHGIVESPPFILQELSLEEATFLLRHFEAWAACVEATLKPPRDVVTELQVEIKKLENTVTYTTQLSMADELNLVASYDHTTKIMTFQPRLAFSISWSEFKYFLKTLRDFEERILNFDTPERP